MADHTGEKIGCRQVNPVMCMTCLNANGKPPFEDKPTKPNCLAYPFDEGARKPPAVMYDGATCRFYRGA